jgi:hypothetical protein
MVTVVGAIIGLVVVGAVVFFVRGSGTRGEPGVESFRRHIDALSPEARRDVQDRVRGSSHRLPDNRSNGQGQGPS